MRIAIVTSRFPFPLEKGDKLRVFHQIKYLSQFHDIYLFSLSFEKISKKDLSYLQEYCADIKIFYLSKLIQVINLSSTIFTKDPFQVRYFYNRKIKKDLQLELLKSKPDLIYCQLIRCSEYVRDLEFPKILDYMDNMSLGYARRAQETGNRLAHRFNKVESQRLQIYEQDIFSDFDEHTIISERDKNKFIFKEKSNITVVANGVDSTHFAKLQKVNAIGDQSLITLLFVGNMGYEPNRIAMDFFLEEIWPTLDHEKYQLVIAGARPNAQLSSQESQRLIITGWMDDIRQAYANGDIFIAPIFSGSGLQNKILEAMAQKLPVITSSSVNNSIGAVDGKELILADDVIEIQNAIEKLANNEALRLGIGENARKFVEENYTWEENTNKLLQIINKYDKRL